MNEDYDSARQHPTERCWRNFYDHPDVERVELLDATALVRLTSGIDSSGRSTAPPAAHPRWRRRHQEGGVEGLSGQNPKCPDTLHPVREATARRSFHE